METKTAQTTVSITPEYNFRDVLILDFGTTPEDVRGRVYQETILFIASKVTGGVLYPYKDNQDLLRTIKRLGCTTVVSTRDIPVETALLLKGSGVVQIVIGKRDDLVDISDIIIDPMVYKSEQYLVGPRFLLPSILNKIPADEIAKIIDIKVASLIEDVNHNEAEAELIDIVKLYHKLQWDSDFFGLNVGYISCLRLTPNIERHIKKFIRRERIDMLEYLCNCHDRESVETSERNGYSFVDMRLTFEQFLHELPAVEPRAGYTVEKGQEKDIEALKLIATDIYQYSRYYFDKNFDRLKVIEFYRNWVEKAVRGQFDDFIYVLYHDKKPVGFCTIKRQRKNAVSIGLFGLSAQCKGSGLANYLLLIALKRLKEEEGVEYVEVVTQGRNYAAQRLYQRCGFVTKITELWYHKWFH